MAPVGWAGNDQSLAPRARKVIRRSGYAGEFWSRTACLQGLLHGTLSNTSLCLSSLICKTGRLNELPSKALCNSDTTPQSVVVWWVGGTLTGESRAPEELVHVCEDKLNHDGLHTDLHEGCCPVEARGLYVLRPVEMQSYSPPASPHFPI